jgi:parallel beta-helix repeat protein
MKNTWLSLAVLALCIGVFVPARAAALGVTRIVDDDGRASSVSCDAATPAPRSIQAAIDMSASGDTILVCPGVYEEQLKIVSKVLTIQGVTSGVQNQVLIRPSGIIANSTNAFSGNPIAAVVAIEDSASVTLQNLTVDGGDNRLSACAPTLVGVFYRNSSGTAQSIAVRNVRLGPSLGTCQSGYGIFAQSGAGGVSNLTVNGSSINGYQKVGILGNEDGTQLQAVANAVSGDGVTSLIAQNGIQIGFGAIGRIVRNSVANHVYTCPTVPCDASTNILVFESNGVTVRGNNTAKAVIGIYLVGSDGSDVRNNGVSDSDVLDGIAVVGNGNQVRGNRIVNSGEFALSVEGGNNRFDNNVVNDAPCGVFTNGNGNSLVGNSIFNTELTTCAPFQVPLSLSSQARSVLSSGLATGNALGTPMVRDASGTILKAATPVR